VEVAANLAELATDKEAQNPFALSIIFQKQGQAWKKYSSRVLGRYSCL
jgi:hypothetical protein